MLYLSGQDHLHQEGDRLVPKQEQDDHENQDQYRDADRRSVLLSVHAVTLLSAV